MMWLPFRTHHCSILNPSIFIINTRTTELLLFTDKQINNRDLFYMLGWGEDGNSPACLCILWTPFSHMASHSSLWKSNFPLAGSSASFLIFTSNCALLIVRLVVLEESLVLNPLLLFSVQPQDWHPARHHVFPNHPQVLKISNLHSLSPGKGQWE